MNSAQKKKYLKITNDLIEESSAVLGSKYQPNRHYRLFNVDAQKLNKWMGKFKSLGHQLGNAAAPWQEIFSLDTKKNSLSLAQRVLGTIEAIQHEIENDYLSSFTQFVKAETLADLLEQAEHLKEQGYYLAAAVIGRAILEEHLRNLCEEIGCMPEKNKPTINDFNQSLYKEKHYSKIVMKHVDTLAAIGNAAAHNTDEFNSSDAEKLINDLPSLIDSTKV